MTNTHPYLQLPIHLRVLRDRLHVQTLNATAVPRKKRRKLDLCLLPIDLPVLLVLLKKDTNTTVLDVIEIISKINLSHIHPLARQIPVPIGTNIPGATITMKKGDPCLHRIHRGVFLVLPVETNTIVLLGVTEKMTNKGLDLFPINQGLHLIPVQVDTNIQGTITMMRNEGPFLHPKNLGVFRDLVPDATQRIRS